MHFFKKHRIKAALYCAFLIFFLVFGLLTINFSALTPQSINADGSFLSAGASLSLSARCAVLIEAETGRIIYALNQNSRQPMASTTKIMTALLAIENEPLDKIVTIPEGAVGVEGSSVYLKAGEQLTLESLLYALLLESANDAAAAIAIEIGGSIEGFAAMMNSKARELGLENTSFTNPHGLDNENHYTTASDLALIARCALEDEDFAHIVSTRQKIIQVMNDSSVRYLTNHNKLLRLYDGAIGVKTGFTKKSGRCLVSAAEREGVRLIAVTLNAPNDWDDHERMLDYGFSQIERVSLCKSGDYNLTVPIISGSKKSVNVTNKDSLSIIMPKGEHEITVTAELERFYFAPVSAGDMLGCLVFKDHGEILGRVPLYSEADVALAEKQGFFDKIFSIFK